MINSQTHTKLCHQKKKKLKDLTLSLRFVLRRLDGEGVAGACLSLLRSFWSRWKETKMIKSSKKYLLCFLFAFLKDKLFKREIAFKQVLVWMNVATLYYLKGVSQSFLCSFKQTFLPTAINATIDLIITINWWLGPIFSMGFLWKRIESLDINLWILHSIPNT